MIDTDTNKVAIRAALPSDIDAIKGCVGRAYEHYITRIGKPPGPMLADYADVIATHHVWVAELNAVTVGVLALMENAEGVLLDNVAVDPTAQGQGIGKRLMAHAEAAARQLGYRELRLYTHELMTENIAMYGRLGYRQTERRSEAGYRRVYMSKSLTAKQ